MGFDIFANDAGIATHVDELFHMFKSHKLPLETAYTPTDKAVRETPNTISTNKSK